MTLARVRGPTNVYKCVVSVHRTRLWDAPAKMCVQCTYIYIYIRTNNNQEHNLYGPPGGNIARENITFRNVVHNIINCIGRSSFPFFSAFLFLNTRETRVSLVFFFSSVSSHRPHHKIW